MKKLMDYAKKPERKKREMKHIQVRLTLDEYALFCQALEKKNMSAQTVLMAGVVMFIEEAGVETKKTRK